MTMKNLFYVSVITLFICLQFACGNHKTSTAVSNTNPLTVIQNGPVKIAYTDNGKGDTTLFFVHGWGINKSYFANQVDHFGKKYRVITMDRPGFGQSGKNRTDWSTEAYASDIEAVITKLYLKNVVLVGHSMAGDIVLQAALTDTNYVVGIVGIDNFKTVGIPQDAKSKETFKQAINSLQHNFKQVASAYFTQYLFANSTPDSIKTRILSDIAKNDSTIAIANMVQGNNFDEVAKLKQYRKKLYLINSDYMPTNTSGLTQNNIPFMLTYVNDTGHFPMVEKPQDFNACLEKILADIKAHNAK
jgi:pimeloyl-ACP methyl ester carboxylesterase